MNDGCQSCGADDKALCGIMLCVECRTAFEAQGRRIKELEAGLKMIADQPKGHSDKLVCLGVMEYAVEKAEQLLNPTGDSANEVQAQMGSQPK